MKTTAGRRLAVVVCLLAGTGAAVPATPPQGAARAMGPEAGLGRHGRAPDPPISAEGLLRLAAEAGRVVLARCLGVEPARREASQGGGLQVATFRVEESFKGPGRASLRLLIRDPDASPSLARRRQSPAWSSGEILHYAPPDRDDPAATPGTSPQDDEARRERLARLERSPSRPASPTVPGTAPPRFHPGERALLFLPGAGRGPVLEAGTPGYAKLVVVESGSGGEARLVPVAGPAWLIAPAARLGPEAPTLDGLLDALRRGLPAAEEDGAEPGRRRQEAVGARP